MKLKAMIFAAGLGTRLYPLTADKPKALVEFQGVSLLERVVKRLSEIGIQEIVVNVHHFAELLKQECVVLAEKYHLTIDIADETAKLLDTGGGLENARNFFKDTDIVLTHNVDIISTIRLSELIEAHLNSNADATLCVQHRNTQRYFLFNRNLELCGWKNQKTQEEIIVKSHDEILIPLAFSGIGVLNRQLLETLHQGGAYSITPKYLEWAKSYSIKAFRHDDDFWFDAGKYEEFIQKFHILLDF